MHALWLKTGKIKSSSLRKLPIEILHYHITSETHSICHYKIVRQKNFFHEKIIKKFFGTFAYVNFKMPWILNCAVVKKWILILLLQKNNNKYECKLWNVSLDGLFINLFGLTVYIYISYFCVKLFSSFYNAQKGALKVTGESTRKPIKTFHLYLKYVKLYWIWL